MHLKGFSRADFRRLHPGGAIAARLRPVEEIMHSGAQMPLTGMSSSMHDTIGEMSAKQFGVVGVIDGDGYLVGVITDGDLRRHMEEGLDHVASEFMTHAPKTIAPDALVDDALTLFDEHRITTLFVVQQEGERQRPLGVLHIHDCPSAR